MGLTTAAVKHILLLLNFILVLLGIVLIGFGIYVLVSAASNIIDHGENVAGGLIIALAVVILAIAIFGCLAAIHESRGKLLIYVILVVILILVQLIVNSMTTLGSKDGVSGSAMEGFDMLWEIEQKEPGALAYYEDWLHCCGVNNTDDYRRIHHQVPKTCCKAHICAVENIFPEGCLEKFEEYLSQKLLTVSIVNWILIILEIAAAVLGWIMFTRLKNQSRRANMAWM